MFSSVDSDELIFFFVLIRWISFYKIIKKRNIFNKCGLKGGMIKEFMFWNKIYEFL